MIKIRYTPIITKFKNEIYVFGGKISGDGTNSILSFCEKYNFSQKKWCQIAEMNYKRSTGFCLVYNNQIYVFGGYTGSYQRSNCIEVYNEKINL